MVLIFFFDSCFCHKHVSNTNKSTLLWQKWLTSHSNCQKLMSLSKSVIQTSIYILIVLAHSHLIRWLDGTIGFLTLPTHWYVKYSCTAGSHTSHSFHYRTYNLYNNCTPISLMHHNFLSVLIDKYHCNSFHCSSIYRCKLQQYHACCNSLNFTSVVTMIDIDIAIAIISNIV